MDRGQRPSIVVDNTRRSIHAWQDRIRDPSLTVLLVLQLCTIFVAAPLAAKGLPMARTVADTLVLAVLAIVVMLSRKWGAIVVILLGLAATAASFLPTGEWSPVSRTIARHGGAVLAFSALVWVVAHAVYAPGRITLHRLQGAIVIYLSLAMIFATGRDRDCTSALGDARAFRYAAASAAAPERGPSRLAREHRQAHRIQRSSGCDDQALRAGDRARRGS